jgi:hypothetical protein
MVSTLGDEQVPTTEVDSYTVAPLNSIPDSALVPVMSRQPDFATSPGPETLLVVGYHVPLPSSLLITTHLAHFSEHP